MNPSMQKRLAILGAVLSAALFVAANIHLITVALRSQSGCVVPAPDKPPARRVC